MTNDFWLCEPGRAHSWVYRKNLGYRCSACGATCTKEELQEATNDA